MMEDITMSSWPQNLMEDLEIEPAEPLELLGQAGNIEVAMLMSNMPDNEKECIRMRYMQGMTYLEMAKKLGKSHERVRQVTHRALRRLRHPRLAGVIRHGVMWYIDQRVHERAEQMVQETKDTLEADYHAKVEKIANSYEAAMKARDESRKEKVAAMEVEELGLSVRAYNCVKRAGCDTVGQLITRFPTYDDACKIRNLGSKSLKEVSDKLREFEIEWPKMEDAKVKRTNVVEEWPEV